MKTIPEIQHAVAECFGMKLHALKGMRRAAGVSRARMIAMYLCRRLNGASYPDIARSFGGFNHTTVIHACRRIHEHADPAVQATITDLVAQLGGDPPVTDPVSTSRKVRLPTPLTAPVTTTLAVITAVCEHFKVKPELLRVLKPNRRTVYIRSVAICLARDLAIASHDEIRAALGINLLQSNLSEATMRIRWSTDPHVKAEVATIRRALVPSGS